MNMYNFPIIIAEGLDVNFYMSVSSVQDSIEAVDIQNDVYKAYDSLGNKIVLSIIDDKIYIKIDYENNLKIELEKLLIDFLKAIEFKFSEKEESLASLLKKCSKFYQ